MDRVKISKLFIVHCLPGYKLQPHFISNTACHADLPDNLPPVTAFLCFLSCILSTVPMVIEPYSESKAGMWGRRGGERCSSA